MLIHEINVFYVNLSEENIEIYMFAALSHKVFDIIFGLIERGLFGGWSRASRANVVSPLG